MMDLNNKGFAISGSILTTFVSVGLSIAIFLLVLPILWNVFGFEPVRFSDGLMDVIGKVDYVVYIVGYFLPIEFIGGCIVIILIARNANLFLSLIDYFIKKIGGN